MSVPVPPSNGSPSILPTKSIVDAVALLGLAPPPSRRIGAVLARPCVSSACSTSASATSATGFSSSMSANVADLEFRQHLDGDRVGEVALRLHDLLDLALAAGKSSFGSMASLKLFSSTIFLLASLTTLLTTSAITRAAIEAFQMRDRHLAGTEAVDADLVLHIDELGFEPAPRFPRPAPRP